MNLKKLGICIYPEIVGVDATIEYINIAHRNGFSKAFANLLELPNNEIGNAKLQELKRVYQHVSALGMEMIVDVNPLFYKEFNLQPDELIFFKNLGITGVRLDEDFGGEVEARLSNNNLDMTVELNASAGNETFINAIKYGANASKLAACHNFYPMRYTGLDQNRFIELSTYYKQNKIKVIAFITLPEAQKGIGPWNVNEGMPTLEIHRDSSLEDQFIDLISFEVVDDIMISQQGATEQQLVSLGKILNFYNNTQKQEVVELPIKFEQSAQAIEKDIVINNKGKTHKNRPDFNGYFWRSTWPRIDYKTEKIGESNSGRLLNVGDVVILNENLGRYKCEMHIILRPIDDREQKARNLVGKVALDNPNLLKLLNKKAIKLKEVS